MHESQLDCDFAQITLDNYTELCITAPEIGFHKSPITALKLFRYIRSIVRECLNIESDMHRHSVIVGPSDSVYRRLESVIDFLVEINYKRLMMIRSLNTVIDEIRSIIEGLVENVKPLMLAFPDIVSGFKITTYQVYRFSHHVAYNRLGSILQVHLDVLKEDITDLTTWKPTKSFYRNSCPIYVNIEPGRRVITLTTSEIRLREYEVDYELDVLSRIIPPSILSSKMVDLDWSFDEKDFTSNRNMRSPLNYIYKADRTVSQLLKAAKYFQKKMSSIEILPENLHCVIIMCNGLLICGKRILNKMKIKRVRELFDIVFSVLDRVHSLILQKMTRRKLFYGISYQCSLVPQFSLPFKYKLNKQEDGSFEDYMDVVYKFIVKIFLPIGDRLFGPLMFYTAHEIRIVVHRTFLPSQIGGRITNWKNKFDRYKTLEDLVNDSETTRYCSVCQKSADISKPETIAISELCNHLHCVSCLMKIVNKSMESNRVRRMPKAFKCLHPSCRCLHSDFISGELYDFFQNGVMDYTAAYGLEDLPPNMRIKKLCTVHGMVHPGDCSYMSRL